jgi:predicted nuclease of predicted toxin-antitoxin system
MAVYLIDANLPYNFSLWSGTDYIHVRDIDDEWSDTRIWEYAKQNDLTIVTKDADLESIAQMI